MSFEFLKIPANQKFPVKLRDMKLKYIKLLERMFRQHAGEERQVQGGMKEMGPDACLGLG